MSESKDKEFLFEITVGGNRIPVYEIEDLRDDDDELLDGRWRPKENEIWLRAELPFERLLVTLLHEAFHAAESEFHMSVDHRDIYTLSSVAIQVLSRLPGEYCF